MATNAAMVYFSIHNNISRRHGPRVTGDGLAQGRTTGTRGLAAWVRSASCDVTERPDVAQTMYLPIWARIGPCSSPSRLESSHGRPKRGGWPYLTVAGCAFLLKRKL